MSQTDIEHTYLGSHPENVARQVSKEAVAADRLRSLIERYERLDEEVKALNGDKKDIMAEAKSAGFDTKAMRAIIKIRAQNPSEVAEHDTMVELYREALGL